MLIQGVSTILSIKRHPSEWYENSMEAPDDSMGVDLTEHQWDKIPLGPHIRAGCMYNKYKN